MDKRGEGTTFRNEFAPRVFAAGRMGPIRAALLLSLGALVLAAQLGAATKTVLVGPDGTLTFRDMESGTDTTTVTAGDRVQWEWVSGFHSTTRVDAPETWDSGVQPAPFSFSRRFLVPGTYPYVCTVHEFLGMTGTVVVLPATSTTGPPTTTTTVTSTTVTTTTTLPPVLQCEDTVARRLATLGTDIVGCHIRTARRVLRRQGIRQAACERHARARYARAVRKLNPGRCPGCLLGNLAPFRDRMTSLLDDLAPRVFCAPGLPVAGSQPAARRLHRCEDGTARQLAGLLRALVRCRIRAADAPFTGQPVDEIACIAAAKDRFDGAIGKLRLGLCPPCLDPGRLRDELESAVGGLGTAVYCAASWAQPANRRAFPLPRRSLRAA